MQSHISPFYLTPNLKVIGYSLNKWKKGFNNNDKKPQQLPTHNLIAYYIIVHQY